MHEWHRIEAEDIGAPLRERLKHGIVLTAYEVKQSSLRGDYVFLSFSEVKNVQGEPVLKTVA
jgi:hypothetical protein